MLVLSGVVVFLFVRRRLKPLHQLEMAAATIAEGDFSIKAVADFLRDAIGEEEILGRIGGDEFVAIIRVEKAEEADQICEKIRERAESFNAGSGKPYYVECSLGYNAFVCDESVEIQDVLDQADRELYKSKKNRRGSAVR